MINDRYVIKKEIGKGRSSVYLCEDSEFPGKDFAIKILSPESEESEIKAFKNEFFTLRKLNHPNIVRPHEFGTIVKVSEKDKNIEIGSKFFTLDYFAGKELLKFPELDDEIVLREIISQLCSALYYLHQSNYIYYDLKPENILVSSSGSKTSIKLIDLGFAQYIIDNDEDIIRGTAEYIAPEILKKEEHDHRVDFYSLGMMLYKVVYGTFPFELDQELEIYKAHLEKEFDFPESNFSPSLMNIIKKLLSKKPDERYSHAIQIIDDLNIEISEDFTHDWIPAKVFTNRKDVLTIFKTYIKDDTSNEVFSIKGFEGSGKTALSDEIYSSFNNVVYISGNISKNGMEFLKYFIRRIVYNDFVYSQINDELKSRIDDFLQTSSTDFIDELKSIFNAITRITDFIIIMDGFNNYDEFMLSVLKNIVPIFQVNKIKVILAETSDFNYKSDIIFNLREINLTPFTDVHLEEYINRSFYKLFPKEDLKKLILRYADLLPGNIVSFIKDIVILNIIRFSPDGVVINLEDEYTDLLKSSHQEIYNLRLKKLTDEELEFAQLLSSLEISPNYSSISKLLNVSVEEVARVISNLQIKNIIKQFNRSELPVFISDGLKKHIASTIENKEEYHSNLAEKIKSTSNDISLPELAKQYELAGKYDLSYKIFLKELDEAEKVAAYSYQRNILVKLQNFPLSKKDSSNIKYKLAKAYFQTGEYKAALELTDELLKVPFENRKLDSLFVQKGTALIAVGEIEKGIQLLDGLAEKTTDETERLDLQVEIAAAKFDLNEYSDTSKICGKIIGNDNASLLNKGKCYNILGLVDIFLDNNLNDSLKNFEKAEKVYEEAGARLEVAKMEMNIGNIYNMKGEQSKAELYWNKSLDINSSIGNLNQEAQLLNNFGIYYYDKLNMEESLKYNKRASEIFMSLGNMQDYGYLQYNLGEIYYYTCDFQNAIEAVENSKKIALQLHNNNEVLQSLFLLGKIYFSIGYYEQLQAILNEFNSLIDFENVSENNKISQKYLQEICKIADDKNSSSENLKQISEELFEANLSYDYFMVTTHLINLLIEQGKFEEALKEINYEKFTEFCSSNFLFDAERNYILGELSKNAEHLDLHPPIKYYLSAYELIEDKFISELTWKVLYSLSEYYGNRGNLSKAKDYLKYAKALIYYIADKIKNYRVKNSYLEHPERKNALQVLEELEMQY